MESLLAQNPLWISGSGRLRPTHSSDGFRHAGSCVAGPGWKTSVRYFALEDDFSEPESARQRDLHRLRGERGVGVAGDGLEPGSGVRTSLRAQERAVGRWQRGQQHLVAEEKVPCTRRQASCAPQKLFGGMLVHARHVHSVKVGHLSRSTARASAQAALYRRGYAGQTRNRDRASRSWPFSMTSMSCCPTQPEPAPT